MNILLIEDDRKITEALTLAFAAEGYKTIPCRTCADAYSKAAEQFDLMIIDITLLHLCYMQYITIQLIPLNQVFYKTLGKLQAR